MSKGPFHRNHHPSTSCWANSTTTKHCSLSLLMKVRVVSPERYQFICDWGKIK